MSNKKDRKKCIYGLVSMQENDDMHTQKGHVCTQEAKANKIAINEDVPQKEVKKTSKKYYFSINPFMQVHSTLKERIKR